MSYLKINWQLRLFLGVIGLVTLLYGVGDINSGEAGRKGLNSTKDEQPVSYYFTVGKKVLIGCGFFVLALSPFFGTARTVSDEKRES